MELQKFVIIELNIIVNKPCIVIFLIKIQNFVWWEHFLTSAVRTSVGLSQLWQCVDRLSDIHCKLGRTSKVIKPLNWSFDFVFYLMVRFWNFFASNCLKIGTKTNQYTFILFPEYFLMLRQRSPKFLYQVKSEVGPLKHCWVVHRSVWGLYTYTE